MQQVINTRNYMYMPRGGIGDYDSKTDPTNRRIESAGIESPRDQFFRVGAGADEEVQRVRQPISTYTCNYTYMQ